MSFPTMTSTWKFSTTGLTNVIPLPEGGGPYTIGLDKAGATYTGQLFWSRNLDASFKDDSWEVLSDLDTVDVAGLVPPAAARAIMGSITVRPTPVVSAGIATPVAKFEIIVTTANPKGVQNKQRHASGYGANLIAGGVPVQDEYEALVLADMTAHGEGSLWTFQDASLPAEYPSQGPDVQALTKKGTVFVGPGPWGGAISIEHIGGDEGYREIAPTKAQWDSANQGGIEGWFAFPDPTNPGSSAGFFGNDISASSTNDGMELRLDDAGGLEGDLHFSYNSPGIGVPATWLASTVYAKGDYIRSVATGRVKQCTIAGTSGACEPTWDDNTWGNIVVDNTATWIGGGNKNGNDSGDINFGDAATSQGFASSLGFTPVANKWIHLAIMKTTGGHDGGFKLYLNGAVALAIEPASDTIFGTYSATLASPWSPNQAFSTLGFLMGTDSAGEFGPAIRFAYGARYFISLTDAQVLAHYNKGVELGLDV